MIKKENLSCSFTLNKHGIVIKYDDQKSSTFQFIYFYKTRIFYRNKKLTEEEKEIIFSHVCECSHKKIGCNLLKYTENYYYNFLEKIIKAYVTKELF